MTELLDLDEFDYPLPRERIAQQPLAERDGGKLMVVDRDAKPGAVRHDRVRGLPRWLREGDLLVVNATRVLPARLRGRRETGGVVEALLLGEAAGSNRHRALVKISGRLRPGIKLRFRGAGEDGGTTVDAEIAELGEDGEVVLAFESDVSPYAAGLAPLPPYIRREDDSAAQSATDLERYQTVFARVPGAIAAPTAGLHLTERLLRALEERGVGRAEVVLHVGPGTFRPLREEDLRAGRLHAETFELPAATADAIEAARRRGGRVVAVGTTVTRVLECRATDARGVRPGAGETDLFLRPGSRFRVVDALLTNFHLPRSSLLLLVAAFAGRERTLAAYREAVAHDYRFYSYGDAMLVR